MLTKRTFKQCLKHFQTNKAGLKGRGARGNFYWRAPMT